MIPAVSRNSRFIARGLSVHSTFSASLHTVVRLSYQDLKAGKDLTEEIGKAFGPDGLGILTVSGVPDFPQRRLALLKLAQPLARLPDSVKKKLEHKESTYNFGWSHGKEKFQNVLDVFKGSYYANPQMDVPTTDKKLVQEFPANFSPNIWPPENVLPGFASAFKSLGQLLVDVGLLVAVQSDNYVLGLNKNYERGKLHRIIRGSRTCKARLLHYFPPEEVTGSPDVDWCGWHTDHGSLTGLTSALYVKDDPVANPDPLCGLYIKNRKGEEVKIMIPEGDIGYQIGDSSQITSGNLLQATPHYVKAPNPKLMKGISRNTYAVFMQPEWNEPLNLPQGTNPNNIKEAVRSWEEGMTFASFMKAKLVEYY